ncbi:transcription factor [Schizosaccharomyces cryophilus OY26]|uniref:Transcription factor n=1 Tax=Schizosaccharomyces cryophilus (strain OY26 / ATCC MYA-4695 / CBS 11777 / NBRC 106824 / NRRL Y48691) TaxID=653667 RepID=S9WZB9_SCHCR|nr:transcription factor [Schizosaccharomyces cryophilus OY26]EPY50062.1 transcription factor [Schizosaccharomyces cryophilus OY26]
MDLNTISYLPVPPAKFPSNSSTSPIPPQHAPSFSAPSHPSFFRHAPGVPSLGPNDYPYPYLFDPFASQSSSSPSVPRPVNVPVSNSNPQDFQVSVRPSSVRVSSSASDEKRRKKVSRACDLCRKKKIRCDMVEGSTGACINCSKHNLQCIYTRTQLKRGPVKGLIRNPEDKTKRLRSNSTTAAASPLDTDAAASPSSTLPDTLPFDVKSNSSSPDDSNPSKVLPMDTAIPAVSPVAKEPILSKHPKPTATWHPQQSSHPPPSPFHSQQSQPVPSTIPPFQQSYPYLSAPSSQSVAGFHHPKSFSSTSGTQPSIYTAPSVQPFVPSSLPFQSNMNTAYLPDSNLRANPTHTPHPGLAESPYKPMQPPPIAYPPALTNGLSSDPRSLPLPSIASFDNSRLNTVSQYGGLPNSSYQPPIPMQPVPVNSPGNLPNFGRAFQKNQLPESAPSSIRQEARSSTLNAGPNVQQSRTAENAQYDDIHEISRVFQEDIEWDDEAVDRYYLLIHSTLPILHHSKTRLKLELEKAPKFLRSCCLHAIYSLVNRPPFSSLGSIFHKNPMKAIGLLNLICTNVQDISNRILHLQTMILLAVESDQRGPTTITGRNGLPQSMWHGAAVGLACNMRLHIQSHISLQSTNQDMDGNEALCRRAWWVLVILDRWHSVSTCSPLFIPDSCIKLSIQDQKVLGSFPSQLVRLSLIVGHISDVFQSPDPSDRENPIVTQQLRSEIDAFRESVDVVWGRMNLLTLAVTHVKVLLELSTNARPSAVLTPAMKMANILSSSSTPLTPLNHHFFSLAACVLIGVYDIPELQDEARQGLEYIRECIEKRRDIVSRKDHEDWDYVVLKLINAKMQGMHIASDPPAPPHVPSSSIPSYNSQEVDSVTFKDAYLYTRLCNLGYLGFLI